jgi:hypothetical protein
MDESPQLNLRNQSNSPSRLSRRRPRDEGSEEDDGRGFSFKRRKDDDFNSTRNARPECSWAQSVDLPTDPNRRMNKKRQFEDEGDDELEHFRVRQRQRPMEQFVSEEAAAASSPSNRQSYGLTTGTRSNTDSGSSSTTQSTEYEEFNSVLRSLHLERQSRRNFNVRNIHSSLPAPPPSYASSSGAVYSMSQSPIRSPDVTYTAELVQMRQHSRHAQEYQRRLLEEEREQLRKHTGRLIAEHSHESKDTDDRDMVKPPEPPTNENMNKFRWGGHK